MLSTLADSWHSHSYDLRVELPVSLKHLLHSCMTVKHDNLLNDQTTQLAKKNTNHPRPVCAHGRKCVPSFHRSINQSRPITSAVFSTERKKPLVASPVVDGEILGAFWDADRSTHQKVETSSWVISCIHCKGHVLATW